MAQNGRVDGHPARVAVHTSVCAILFHASPRVTKACETRLCALTEIQFVHVLSGGFCSANGKGAHYALVSKIQWKPFWLATQL